MIFPLIAYKLSIVGSLIIVPIYTTPIAIATPIKAAIHNASIKSIIHINIILLHYTHKFLFTYAIRQALHPHDLQISQPDSLTI